MTISESDWKKYKELRAEALERFAQQALDDSQSICRDNSRTAHERYLELYELIRERDREIDRIFDDVRRSTAVMCLKLMLDSGLITKEDLSECSPEMHDMLRLN